MYSCQLMLISRGWLYLWIDFFNRCRIDHRFPGRYPMQLWILCIWGVTIWSCEKAPYNDFSHPETEQIYRAFLDKPSDAWIDSLMDQNTSASLSPGLIHVYKATKYMRNFQYESADSQLLQLLEIESIHEDDKVMAQIYKNRGAVAFYQERYPASLEFMLSSLNHSEQAQDSIGVAEALNNIATLYYSLNNLEFAEKYLQESLELKISLKDSVGMARTLNNLGNVLAEYGRMNEAIHTYLASIEIKEKLDQNIGNGYNNIALIYKDLGQTDSALYFAHKSLKTFVEHGDREGEAYAYNTLAVVNMQNQAFKSAQEYGHKALETATEVGSVSMLNKSNATLSEIYEMMGNSDRALEYLKQSLVFRDSILNENNMQFIAELQEKYESEKKDKEIAVLRLANTIQTTKEKRNKLMLWFVGVFSLATLAWLFVLRRSYRQRVEVNSRLFEANRALSEINALKDRLFTTLSHDLKGQITYFTSMTDYLKRKGNEVEFRDRINALSTLHEASLGIEQTLENILNWAKSQRGYVPMVKTDLDLHQLISEIEVQLSGPLSEKQIQILEHYDRDTILHTHKEVLRIVLRNLISNAIKYSPYGSEIHISFQDDFDGFVLEIRDQGIGISEEEQPVLWKEENWGIPHGDVRIESHGIGLLLVKDCLQKINGTITCSSVAGQGTVFRIRVPK